MVLMNYDVLMMYKVLKKSSQFQQINQFLGITTHILLSDYRGILDSSSQSSVK